MVKSGHWQTSADGKRIDPLSASGWFVDLENVTFTHQARHSSKMECWRWSPTSNCNICGPVSSWLHLYASLLHFPVILVARLSRPASRCGTDDESLSLLSEPSSTKVLLSALPVGVTSQLQRWHTESCCKFFVVAPEGRFGVHNLCCNLRALNQHSLHAGSSLFLFTLMHAFFSRIEFSMLDCSDGYLQLICFCPRCKAFRARFRGLS